MPSSLNVFNETPSESDNFADLWPIMFSTPAVFAASTSLWVIIPSKIRYFIPDWPLILLTNSGIATLKTSDSFESSAIASKDSFNSENLFLL